MEALKIIVVTVVSLALAVGWGYFVGEALGGSTPLSITLCVAGGSWIGFLTGRCGRTVIGD